MNRSKVKKLNIVVLSDLNWDNHLRHINLETVNQLSDQDLSLLRYERVKRYFDIIINEEADLVLFAGDVTGDGFCGQGFQYVFLFLLKLLEEKNIPSCVISGNHDPEINYSIITDWAANSKYCQEISNTTTSILGLKILGINYVYSKSKRSFNKLLKEQEEPIDIVVAHSQIKRRIKHFDFNTNYIVTGHYDRKLFAHRSKVFVALDNDLEEVSYAVLKIIEDESDTVEIKIRHNPNITFGFKESTDALLNGNRNYILSKNNQPAYDLLKFENASDASLSRDGDHFLYLKYLRGINYANSLDTMYKMKNEIQLAATDLSLNQIHHLPITASYKISESMIEDYLGNVID